MPGRNNFNFGTGNFNISLAVDPTNPNVVYLGGSSQFQSTGLLRIDTTGVADPHAFYTSQTDPEGKVKTIAGYGLDGERGIYVGYNPPLSQITEIHGPVVESAPGAAYAGGPTDPFHPYYTPYLNLIANPRNPFLTASTIPVTNTLAFLNSGAKAKFTALDQALKPDTFSTDPTDPWSVPVRGVHSILPIVDQVTGKTRLIFGTDSGIFTAVDDGRGGLVGSLGSVQSLGTTGGDVKVATGSRNGNLQTAELYYGAAEPSTVAAQASLLKGFFYASTNGEGSPYSNTNVINAGQVGYGDTTWKRPYLERSSGAGVAVVQTNSSYADFGSFYRYVLPAGIDNQAGPQPSVATDFFQLDLTSRTFNLIQKTNGQFDPLVPQRVFDVPDAQFPFRKGYNFAVNPLSGEQALISSEEGRVYSTENGGRFWNEIANPGQLDSTNVQALAYGAPDVVGPGLGNLNSFLYAGTISGKIFVTFTGGGAINNAWIDLSAGLDGTAIQQIVTNPTRTSHEAYAVTKSGVYHMVDSKAQNPTWVNITGNLKGLTATLFNDPNQVQARFRDFTSIQADWRYIIPDNFALPNGPSHPMLYVGAEGGVFRSIDNGASWNFFPSIDPGSVDATPIEAGNGGGLPNAIVTDLDLALGEIDPTNGRPNVSTGPNVLLATTYGRGAFTIRLAPIVFPNSKANPAAIHLSQTLPGPGGSDTGQFNNDNITNVTQPYIEGLSEQSAFGSVVQVYLYELTGGAKSANPIGIGQTDGMGRFSVQVFAGIYTPGGLYDASAPGFAADRVIGIQAQDQSLTLGNLTTFGFRLDVTPPSQPNVPTLAAASDTGPSSTDGDTSVTNPFIVVGGVEADAKVFLYRDGGATPVGTRIGPGQIQDPGLLADGVHTYYVTQQDVAGNLSPRSDNPPGSLLRITVDTVKPATTLGTNFRPDLQAASDSGQSNTDNITNVTRPVFDVFNTPGEDTSTVGLYRKATGTPDTTYVFVASRVGSGPVTDNGPLADGSYDYATRQTDLAGNVANLYGTALTVVIDTQGNGPPSTPDLTAATDTGASSTDNFTSATQPQFDVLSNDFGATVQLLRKLASDPVTAYAVVGSMVASPGLLVRISDDTVPADGTYNYASIQIDVAGNVGPRSGALTVVIDRTAAIDPLSLVLDAKSDTGSSNSDRITNAAAPFFTVVTAEPNQRIQLYRKPVGDPDANYVAVGSVATVAAQGSGSLQDPSAPANGSFVYTVQATDLAGNAGPLGLVTVTVTFDTVAPAAAAAPDLRADSDTGASQTDDVTNRRDPVFDVVTTENKATLQLLRKLKTDPNTLYAVVGSIDAGAAGTYQVFDSKSPADGLYTYATRQLDLAGNQGPIGGTLDVRIDTAAPAVPTLGLNPLDDTGTKGDNTTSVLRPRLIGTTEAVAVLLLFGDASGTAVAAADGTFTIIPANDLSVDRTYRLQVSATDLAGNVSTSAPLFLTIDTTAPGSPTAPDLDAASDTGQLSDDNVTKDKAPFFNLLTTETGATVQLYRKMLGEADSQYVLVGQVAGGGKVQDLTAATLADGSYVYATKQIDASGNVGSFGGTLLVQFDTVNPAGPPPPRLDPSSDSGAKGDGVTNARLSRVFNVQATEPTATVQLFRRLQSTPTAPYVLVGQVVGSGQITDASSLPDTTYSYVAGQVDLAGNVGAIGAAIAVTIDSRAPNAPTLTLVSADDTGAKGDAVTSVKRPRFTGVTEPNTLVELLNFGAVIATTISDATTGTYTLQPASNLFDGTYSIQARATDLAANSSTSLSTISLVIDSVAPAVPSIALFIDDDSGLKGDRITSVRQPRIVGTTEAKATVVLLDAAQAVRASTVADAGGAYTLQPPLPLALGTYTYQVRASDLAGNQTLSSPLTIQIVDVPPEAATISLLPADDSGVVGDNITNVNRPRFVGTAGPNVVVALADPSGNLYGTTLSDGSGAYVLRPNLPLADGAYSFRARVSDPTGATSFTPPVAVTIDTKAPVPSALTVEVADDSGLIGDFVTNNRKPRLSGKSEPSGVAALYDASGRLLSAVATGADGSFTLASIYDLPIGVNNLTFRTSDLAGNLSPSAAVAPLSIVKTPGDYDGDGKSDTAIYDATAATFYIQYSSGGSKVLGFGVPNGRGMPAPGDYDGDGKTDLAAYDPTSATFFISYSTGGGKSIAFGIRNHNNMPVPGDYDGDGTTDLAVYDPVDTKFYIFYSTSGLLTQPTLGTRNLRGLALAGDYDGDGKTDLAVFDPVAASFAVVYANGQGGFTRQFGVPNAGDLPIPADYDGDGKTDLAVFDPNPAIFYQLYSNPLFNGGSKIYQYGVPNGRGIPVYADYDGDGKTDTTVFDGAEARFYATLSAGGARTPQLGNSRNRNIPIPSVVGPPASLAIQSVGGGSASLGSDFSPVEPGSARIAPGKTAIGFAFGHPDRLVKVNAKAQVQAKATRARRLAVARQAMAVKVARPTAHDLAMDDLWGHLGE